jgi:predicted thioesterase
MHEPPKVGTTHEKRFSVDRSHAVEFAEHGISPILATPWLVWFLEHTALELLQPYLEEGEMTVGAAVDLEHLAPTPVGGEVLCRAQVVHVDGSRVSLHVEARDAQDQIAKGLHKRRVVAAQRFADLVTKKAHSQ